MNKRNLTGLFKEATEVRVIYKRLLMDYNYVLVVYKFESRVLTCMHFRNM